MLMAHDTTERSKNVLWRFFSSVKLTIVLLIILAVASILGTLIPQREGATEFARNLSPGVVQFLMSLDLFDMYHAFWFRLLIGMLALNLVVCSTDRFPQAWKRFRTRPDPERNKLFETLSPQETALVRTDMKEAVDRVEAWIGRRYRRTQKKETKGRYFFYGEKGRYSHFGVYLVHLSILVIVTGALVGSFFGFEAYVNILEGDKTDTVILRKNGQPLRLGFQVRCDKFNVEFYESGAPKEFRSELTFLNDGKEVDTRSVLVNHPVDFRGVTFYQSSYGNAPGRTVQLKIASTAGEPRLKTMELETGKWLELPGHEGRFQVSEVNGNLMGMMGPAALISIRPTEGKDVRFWIFQNREDILKRFPGLLTQDPRLNPSAFKPYTFYLERLETRFYTGLQVNRDPGVCIVWLGCFLIVAGFFVTFFTSHRRVWIRLSPEKEGIRIGVAGTSNKNPVGLERELEHVRERVKNLFEEE
jgi:cytochrome c biogenesis protein